MISWWLGCGGPATPTDVVEPSGVDPFAFVVIADPHVSREGANADRLDRAVQWVNDHASERGIELVVVVGDIGWTEAGLELSRTLLDGLAVPYVPILGDNEVHAESELLFEQTFAAQYALLGETFEDVRHPATEVFNPDWQVTSWVQNLSLRHRGVRFVGLDFVSRDPRPIYGEVADLNDFPGGTWPFFTAELGALESTDAEDVLLFSHHPLTVVPGALDLAEMDRVQGVTRPVAGRVAGAYAGHFHFSDELEERGFTVFITDATHDDTNTVRVVDVTWEEGSYRYAQSLIAVE